MKERKNNRKIGLGSKNKTGFIVVVLLWWLLCQTQSFIYLCLPIEEKQGERENRKYIGGGTCVAQLSV